MNRYVEDDEEPVELQTIDEARGRPRRSTGCERCGPSATAAPVDAALAAVRDAAAGRGNLLYPMQEALRSRATLGEVSDALRGVFGVPPSR